MQWWKVGLLEGLCGCLKLTVKEKKRKIESKSKELSGEKKRRKLDSESTEKKEDTVDGGENDSEIAEGIPFEEDHHDSMDGESYKCYFEKSICQNIPKHSVIVINNAPQLPFKKYGKLPHWQVANTTICWLAYRKEHNIPG